MPCVPPHVRRAPAPHSSIPIVAAGIVNPSAMHARRRTFSIHRRHRRHTHSSGSSIMLLCKRLLFRGEQRRRLRRRVLRVLNIAICPTLFAPAPLRTVSHQRSPSLLRVMSRSQHYSLLFQFAGSLVVAVVVVVVVCVVCVDNTGACEDADAATATQTTTSKYTPFVARCLPLCSACRFGVST